MMNRDSMKNQDNTDQSAVIKISWDAEKRPNGLGRFPVTQTPVKTHQLELMGKTLKSKTIPSKYFFNLTREQARNMDYRTRKLMTIHKILYICADFSTL